MEEVAVEKASIVVFSGDMDKVFGAFIIANGAAAFDMKVTMFFTFWGLKALQKGNLTGESPMGRMLGLMNRGGAGRIGPSRFNFGGIGRWMFKKMMDRRKVMPLPAMIKQAQELGVRLVACEMSMNVMEIRKEDLIDGVELGGVATFIAEASESKFSLFI
ncbi:MAG: DsrE/DsrF/DrsH-like family protein [Candidatus Krumholzibacteria bacterium]|jgi:peroxiredoxin family protein|nr:DsrE/DsrF/DrsH-like family protein [Candidatus Krumholzibacteria bacterium]